MPAPILATKLFVPPPRAKIVLRLHLNEQLNAALQRKLTLVSAPAGFGKTTLVAEWCNLQKAEIAWLSLDEEDSDPARFLTYLVAALQTISPHLGKGVLEALQSPQPPPTKAILTVLLNELAVIPDDFVLVLDDYHLVDAKAIDDAVTFLIERLPPRMHLVIATREDPHLRLSQLRARDQATELRAADLRFTFAEAAEFLNRVMGLNLSAQDIAALETRTEGWIAGLQLAALALQGQLSMHGQPDTTSFIESFTGSHRFVLDYLLEQVLQRQPESIQTFLLYTSILDRLCGPLCDAVLHSPAGSGEETLAYLERANLFIFPLDHERQWYRYHHLFADLLRQRLQQSLATSPEGNANIAELHQRASTWYEQNDRIFEAFHHAAAANDVERAERLIDSGRMPLHFPGAVRTILDWLASLPKPVLDARPVLWTRYASLSLVIGMTSGVDERLQAAETALQGVDLTDKTRDVIGQIAAARATLALTRYQIETSIAQARRALEYLDPNNFPSRATTLWTLGIAHYFQGDRAASRRAFTDSLALSKPSGNNFSSLLATIGLGLIQELDNELDAAMETYRRALALAGEPALTIAYDAHLGMARIFYEWNDLDAAQQHGEKSVELAKQYDRVIDRYIVCEVFLARLKLARGDVDGAAAMLARTEGDARQKNFVLRLPEIAAAQGIVLLRQGNLEAAAHRAQSYDLPLLQARVHLADGDSSAALTKLATFRQLVEAKGWADEQLKTMVLQAIAFRASGKSDEALPLLGDALLRAEQGGFVRLFVDEGEPMVRLLSEAASHGIMTLYVAKLIAVFNTAKNDERQTTEPPPSSSVSNTAKRPSSLVEPLSERELEVLQLMAQGLSNQEIGERLFLALDTVKGHNRRIFAKLQVQRRTEAVARARELGLL